MQTQKVHVLRTTSRLKVDEAYLVHKELFRMLESPRKTQADKDRLDYLLQLWKMYKRSI